MDERHFLIIFDGATEAMKEKVRSFADAEAAVRAYAEAERRYEDQPKVQVVLVASDSLESVKATHPNFWPTNFATEVRKTLKRVAG